MAFIAGVFVALETVRVELVALALIEGVLVAVGTRVFVRVEVVVATAPDVRVDTVRLARVGVETTGEVFLPAFGAAYSCQGSSLP